MAIFAMMNGDTVSNVIVADDKAATEAALNCTLIEFKPGDVANIGWTMDEDGKFHPPVEAELEDQPVE